MASSLSTRAVLRFLVPGESKPIYYASAGGASAGLRISHAEFEERQVTITDARQLDSPATLAEQGFQLGVQHSGVRDFYRLAQQQQEYEAELIELVRNAVGGESLLVFDHTLRSNAPEIRERHQSRETATVVHNDYTAASARKRVGDLVRAEEAGQRLARRFAIVNVWRSIAGPVLQTPLTCCDARTLAEGDCIASERRARDRIGELELVRFNPRQRWYYYPEMTREEVLLIKTFDSAPDGPARRSVHTTFDNPLAPADAPPRESMESRLLVFY